MLDAIWRGVLIVGYRVMLVWWFVRRPVANGAYVVARRTPAGQGDAAIAEGAQQELLLARNSYKSGTTVPCGGLARGETARAAAARELEEEVGLRIDPLRLEPAGVVTLEYAWRRDRAHFFELHLEPDEPVEIRIDRREVIWAEFVPLSEAQQLDLVPHLRCYLAEAEGPGSALTETGSSSLPPATTSRGRSRTDRS